MESTINAQWTTTKRAALALLALALMLAAATTPALAQEPGLSPDRAATFSFELAVECEPPADATFLGFIPAEGGIRAQLTDPDGDGLFTGSVTVDKFGPGPAPEGTEPVSLPVQIVQGPPTGATALGPQFRVIKDFGVVPAEDRTFAASVSFCDNGGGTDNNGGGVPGDSVVSGDTGTGSSSGSVETGGGGVPGGGAQAQTAPAQAQAGGAQAQAGGAQAQLPATGGASLLALSVVGALLVGGGLLTRRLTR